MISAAVGFHCPTCVQNVARPTIRNRFGGSLAQVPRFSKWIIFSCVALYFGFSFLGNYDEIVVNFGLQPVAVAEGQWWRLITATFLHAGILHLAFNMYAIYLLGPQLELLVGYRRFLSLYFLSALAGSVASYWFSPVDILGVGASGAVFGLLTATIVIGREIHADVSQLLVLLGINVVLGFSGGIDWRAHFGGALAGAFLAWAFTKGNRAERARLHALSVGALSAFLLLAIWLRGEQVQQLLGIL
jgi:membrane associated rhomboid family serine protease